MNEAERIGVGETLQSIERGGPRSTRELRRAGALLGLAVGDALGAAVEFMPRDSFPPVTGFRADGPHGLAAGQWTDDTSMALALADSFALCGSDIEDQAWRYVAWWREGHYSVNGTCFDIGHVTRAALERFERGVPVRECANAAEHTSGNGSIMRLAPVPIYFVDLFPDELHQLAAHAEDSSVPTHRSPQCLSACRYFAVVLAALMTGCDRDEVLSPGWRRLDELHAVKPLHPEILRVARGSYRQKQPSEIRGSGYVVDSLEAALWAFHRAASFREAVLAAVNLGDDADTTGAVCGQLAGAYFGVDGIPGEWLSGLHRRQWLDDVIERLFRVGPIRSLTVAETVPSYHIDHHL